MPDIFEALGPIAFPLIGNSIVIAIFSLLHIAFASLTVAFMFIAPVFESFESMDRTNRFHADVAYGLSRFTLVTFTVSLVLAVLMIELFVGLFPLTNSWMFNQFRYPIFFAVAAFFLHLFSLYAYYHFWEPIRRRSRSIHLALGFLAALFVLVWVAVLDGMGSYMLTPTFGRGSWGNLINPTWIPLVIHRFFGNFVFAGFAIAAYAAWMLGRRVNHPEAPYYLYLLKAGFLIGFGALLIQPFTGLLYAMQIEQAAPEAYRQIIQGRYRGWVYLQFVLIALLFAASHFLLRTVRPERERMLLLDGALLVSAASMVIYAETPGVRRTATFALVALGLFHLYRGWGDLNGGGGERLNRPAVRQASIALGLLALMTYWTMGIIRETARRPDTVRGMISLHDEARTPRFLTERDVPDDSPPPEEGP